LPTEIVGVDADLDAERLRLESLLRDKMEPRIAGIRMVPVPLESGRWVLVIRIPKSWNGPHAVLHNKSRLIFARNSTGVHEASVDEMRAMFTAGASLLGQALEFQRNRMEIIHANRGPLSNLAGGGGRIALHIVPFSAFSAQISCDLRRLVPTDLVPIWCSGCNYGYNVDGRWTKSGSDNFGGYAQVFRNGIIESAAGDVRTLTNQGPVLYTESFENQIATAVERYISSLAQVDVPLPAYVMVGGIRMAGTYVSAGDYTSTLEVHPLPERFCLPTISIEDFASLEEYRLTLKPIFDAVSNAAGYGASRSYNAEGKWIRKT
jgi:hypothetical protein